MQKYWRIYTLINSTLRAWNFPPYLEIGAGDGLNVRRIVKNNEAVSERLIPRDWLMWQYVAKVEDFFSMFAKDLQGKYGVVYLRQWTNENLEERVLESYKLLRDSGMLILDSFDPTGKKNDSWRVAVALKKQELNCGVVRNQYLTVYKTKDIESLKPGVKSATFRKNPEKYLP